MTIPGEDLAKQCNGKVCYPGKKAAYTVLNQAMRHRGRHGRAEQLRAYPCEVCGFWHLTKRAKR